MRPPRRLRITREGWVFILVTLGVGAAAINTGNNLLFLVLGLMLSLIVVSGIMSETTLRKVGIERRLPGRMHAGSPTLVEVSLSNLKRLLASYSVELEDLLVGWTTEKRCYFLKVAAKGKQTAAYRFEVPRRGWVKFRGYRVATRYPFGLFEKWREIDLADEMVVFPKLIAVPSGSFSVQPHAAELARRRPGLGDELHGVRGFRTGDDARAIHWRTSARRGRLMVREFEEQASRRLCIYLDNARSPGGPAEGPDEAVETAISLAASLAVDRAARGHAVELSVRGGVGPAVAPRGSADRLLRFLALLEYAPANDPPPFERLGPGEAVVVTARTDPVPFAATVLAARAPAEAA